MEIYKVLLIGVFYCTPPAAYAEMYKWVDENGHVQFSDRPPPGQEQAKSKQATRPAVEPAAKAKVSQIQADIRAKYQGDPLYPDSIKLNIRRLLQEKRYQQLNDVLDGYQAAVLADIARERDLITAYDAFDINDVSYDKQLNAWVAANPDSYQPYLARARFYYSMAWNARGGKWASETEQKQFEIMNGYFDKATSDLAMVLEKNDQVLVSHYLLVGMMRTSADANGMLQVLQRALDINPATYYVRAKCIDSLTPRWGGSYKAMQAIAEEAKNHLAQNPRLALLEGLIYGEIGDVKALIKKYNEADELYAKALGFGDNPVVLMDRGENNYRREHYADALKDLDQAIALYAEDGDYYYWRSKTHAKLGDYHKAIADIERADLLNPGDEYIESQRKRLASKIRGIGYEKYKKQDQNSAIDNFNTALELTPDDAYLYYRRGRSLAAQGDMTAAVIDLKKAIELNPDDYDFYAMLDYVLAKQKAWGQIIAYWDKYIAAHPGDSRAYVERGGAYYHKGNMSEAVRNAKIAADMGNVEGKEAYAKFGPRAK